MLGSFLSFFYNVIYLIKSRNFSEEIEILTASDRTEVFKIAFFKFAHCLLFDNIAGIKKKIQRKV